MRDDKGKAGRGAHMTRKQKRTFLALGVAIAMTFVVQAFLPTTEAALKAMRSEIGDGEIEREAALPVPAPVVAPVAAHTDDDPVPAPRPASRPVADGAGRADRPLARRGVRRGRRGGWLTAVWAMIRQQLTAVENLSVSTETPHTAQAAPTYEQFALESVVVDPVLPMTGEMVFRHPVVRVPGVGLDFTFELTYRSGFQYNGPVGYNWEHNWNARCRDNADSNGDVTRLAGNRRDVYTASGDDLTSPTGFYEHSITRIQGSPNRIERRLQDGTLEVYTRIIHSLTWARAVGVGGHGP